MKAKHIIISAIAALFAVVGCEKPVDFGPEDVSVSESSIEFGSAAESKTISLTCTVPEGWSLKDYTDDVQAWLTIDPAEGKPSKEAQTITISVLENKGKARSAEIVFHGTVLYKASLKISQAGAVASGDGSKEHPYSAAEANAVASALASGAETESEVYVKGKVCEVKECSKQYGNATFYITDDGQVSEDKFYAFQVKYLGGQKISSDDQIKVGDDVTVKAKLTNYKGNTPETSKGGYIVEHNGKVDDGGDGTPKGEGTEASPYNATAANNAAKALAADQPTAEEYYIEGTIAEVRECSVQYGNATFTISDDGKTSSEQFLVFQVKYFGGEKISKEDQVKVGDYVVVKAKLVNYKGNTPETNKGGEIVKHNSDSSGGDDGGETPVDPIAQPTPTKISIAEFLAKPVSTTDWYELTGEIISIADATNGNITIKDDSGEVYVFGLTSKWIGASNDKSFASIGLKITDTVTIGALRGEYGGNPQASGPIAAYYISHTPGAGENYPAGSVFLTFPEGNKKSVSDYTTTWDVDLGAYSFTLENFNNNKNGWSYVKCGHKTYASVGKISTTKEMPKITKVVVTIDAITKKDKVSSFVLNVYSDAAKTASVATGITAKSGLALGANVFEIPADKQAAKLYYEIVADCQPDGAKNGILQISKVAYAAAE